MLDIAGGSGIDAITFAQHQSALRATVSILPSVIPLTQEIIAHHGRQERATPCPGNYFHDTFAGGNDRILLSTTLQTEEVEICRMLLEKYARYSRRMGN